MTTSTGLSSNVGGPSGPTPNELEQSAATQVMKHLIGLTGDSLSLPFSQLDRDTVWKYKSNSNNPTIGQLSQTRLGEGALTPSNEAFVAAFNLLLTLIPEEILLNYVSQLQLPADQRDPSYRALDTVLGYTASILVALELMSLPLNAVQIDLSHIAQFDALPSVLQANILLAAADVLGTANAFLESGGHALANFDVLSNATGQMGVLFNDLKTLISQGDGASKASWAVLAGDLSALSKSLQGMPLGNELLMLLPTVNAMALIAAASSLGTGSAAVLIGLNLALTNLSLADGTGGLVAPTILSVLESISSGMLTLVHNANSGVALLLTMLLSTAVIAASSLALWGVGPNAFALELALPLLISSGVMEAIATGIVGSLGIDEKGQKVLADVLVGTFLFTVIQTAALNNQNAAGIVESVHDSLVTLHGRIEKFASELSTGSLSTALNVYLQQSQIALNENDSAAYLKAQKDLIDSMDSELEIQSLQHTLKVQMEALKQFVKVLENTTYGYNTQIIAPDSNLIA